MIDSSQSFSREIGCALTEPREKLLLVQAIAERKNQKVVYQKKYIIKDWTGVVTGEDIKFNRNTLLSSFISSASTETLRNSIVAISLVLLATPTTPGH